MPATIRLGSRRDADAGRRRHRAGRRPRHRGLHVAGAGARPARRSRAPISSRSAPSSTSCSPAAAPSSATRRSRRCRRSSRRSRRSWRSPAAACRRPSSASCGACSRRIPSNASSRRAISPSIWKRCRRRRRDRRRAATARLRAGTGAGDRLGRGPRSLAGALLGALVVCAARRAAARGEPPSIRYLTYSGSDWDAGRRRPTAGRSPSSRPAAASHAHLAEAACRRQRGRLDRGPTTTSPRFSPDGSALLFVRRRRTRGPRAVPRADRRRRAATADRQRRSTATGRPTASAWRSSGGARTAAAGRAVDRRRPTEPTRVSSWTSPKQARRTSPRWSPDGRLIAAIGALAGTSEPSRILLVDVASADMAEVLPAHRPALAGVSPGVERRRPRDPLHPGRHPERDQPERSRLGGAARRRSRTSLASFSLCRGRRRPRRARRRPPAAARRLHAPDAARAAARRCRTGSGRRLSGGITMDRQPTYSPDGSLDRLHLEPRRQPRTSGSCRPRPARCAA